MPILPPVLDDRRFDDLVAEVLARIPAHTPEWSNPRVGDPGRTLVDLFAWLTDTLLYRVNRIPERQKLAFLRMLGMQMRPAVAARGMVTLSPEEASATGAILLREGARVQGPVTFETRGEITVLPVTAACFRKRPLDEEEAEEMAELIGGLGTLYGISGTPLAYVTTPVFPGGKPDRAGFDLVRHTVDGSLWIALLAARASLVEAVRGALGGAGGTALRLLNVGVAPSIEVPAIDEEMRRRGGVPHLWEMSTGREVAGDPEYFTLEEVEDRTGALTRSGVVRLALPAGRDLGVLSNDVRAYMAAGTGDRPPRLDAPELSERLVAWLRLRPRDPMGSLRLSWVGINAVEIDQRETLTRIVVGQSDGTSDQEMRLPATSVERETIELEVEEGGAGYQRWRATDDLATAGRDDLVYELDAEAGTVRFGDGVRGRIPELGRRVRVARMRAGGGSAGNLPAGTLAKVAAVDLSGAPARVKAVQPLPTGGGENAETLEEAERRVPAVFRHRDRAVTEQDFRELAATTPGVRVGRVEVLPRFRPQQRRSGVPGVVSVMVLPYQEARQAPNPRPDRPFLEGVHSWLEPRRPLAAEMYVIGCEYVPVGVSASVSIRDGWAPNTVLNAVREALRAHLWPLPPGGPDEGGWPTQRAVRDRDLEVVVARVSGVSRVAGVNLFEKVEESWRMVPRARPEAMVEVPMSLWQLPELLSVQLSVGDAEPPTELSAPPPVFRTPGGSEPTAEPEQVVAVPVVPEVC